MLLLASGTVMFIGQSDLFAHYYIVESLVLVAMLTLVVSHRVLNQIRLLAPEKSQRFTPLRWGESFYSAAPFVMTRTLKYAGIDEDL